MATYHFTMKIGGRGKARPHADYICREGKYSEKEDKEAVEYIEYGNMPEWAKDNPRDFWKSADEYERANGTTYREIEIALPREITPEQRRALVQDFIDEHIGTRHPYTFAMHNPPAKLGGGQQPHAHIMYSERTLDGIERDNRLFFKQANSKNPERGGARKDDTYSGKYRIENLKKLRQAWAKYQNDIYKKLGLKERVDHRSLSSQKRSLTHSKEAARLRGNKAYVKLLEQKIKEVDRTPQQHLGPKAAAMEARGEQTRRGDQNRTAMNIDAEIKDLEKEYAGLKQEIIKDTEKERERRKEIKAKERQKAAEIKKEAGMEMPSSDIQKDYIDRVNDSHGDQRTGQEKRAGIEIGEEENVKRSRGKFLDAERDLEAFGPQKEALDRTAKALPDKGADVTITYEQVMAELEKPKRQAEQINKELLSIKQEREKYLDKDILSQRDAAVKEAQHTGKWDKVHRLESSIENTPVSEKRAYELARHDVRSKDPQWQKLTTEHAAFSKEEALYMRDSKAFNERREGAGMIEKNNPWSDLNRAGQDLEARGGELSKRKNDLSLQAQAYELRFAQDPAKQKAVKDQAEQIRKRDMENVQRIGHLKDLGKEIGAQGKENSQTIEQMRGHHHNGMQGKEFTLTHEESKKVHTPEVQQKLVQQAKQHHEGIEKQLKDRNRQRGPER